MNLTIKGKQLDIGESLRQYVSENLNLAVEKYFNKPIDGTVVMSHQTHIYRADISVHVGRNIMLQSSAEAGEPYPAFDLALDKIAKRLRRYKRKLNDHHRRSEAEMEAMHANQYILEGEKDTDEEVGDQPVVVAEMKTPIDSLTVSEAVMRMDLADLPAMMFKNSAHGGLNMVYRRPDGNVGWIDPSLEKEDSEPVKKAG